MASAVRMHVTSDIMAVTVQPTIPRFVNIPVGSVIETSNDLLQPGLHPVTFEGRELLAFAQDIQERAHAVGSTRLERFKACPPPISVSTLHSQNDRNPRDIP